MVAVIQPVQIIAWIYAGAMRGAGDTKYAFYITALANWTFRALGVVLAIRVFGLQLPHAVAFMCLDQAARAVLMFLRYRSGKWMLAIRDKHTKEEAA